MTRKITSGTAKKRPFVKAGMIKKLTGWSDKEMLNARRTGLITWEYSEETGFNYDPSSLNQLFIKQNAGSATN